MFREQYRKDNELLKAPDRLPEEIYNMTSRNNKNRRTFAIAAMAAACLVVIAAAAVILPSLIGQLGDPAVIDDPVVVSDLHMASDYDEIYAVLEDLRNASPAYGMAGLGSVMTDGAMVDTVFEESETKEPTDSFNAAVDSADDFSQTNTQVENVDEGDIIKNDSRYIYRLTENNVVIIDTQSRSIVSRVHLDDQLGKELGEKMGSNHWCHEMYITDNRMAVLYSQYIYNEETWKSESFCGALLYDITDRSAPAFIANLSQSGDMSSSRVVGDYLYMITSYHVYSEAEQDQPETYVPMFTVNGDCKAIGANDICIMPEVNSSSYVVVSSVNINDGSGFTSTQAALGRAANVYADTGVIILSYGLYESETIETQENGEDVIITGGSDKTQLISYNISDGAITPAASGTVPGHLLNQFSIDRYNGVVRVVTTCYEWVQRIYTAGIDRHESESFTTNGLYTLDESLNVIGALDGLAEDERVYSVRFTGDIGYFVTFRETDPLFAVDLSDPANPILLSALKIPGFSQYMHPYADGLMLGLGRDADEKTGSAGGLKLSMFDISDPTNVTERHKLIIDSSSYSEALYNHKAIVVSAQRDIIAFPTETGYVIYGYGDDGFYERFVLDIGGWLNGHRGLYIGDCFYVCTADVIWCYDMMTFTRQYELSLIN